MIPAEFDSMIAKMIAWGRDRDEALARLRRALAETMVVVDGGTTNQGFLLALLDRPEVRAGDGRHRLARPAAAAAARSCRCATPTSRCCRRRSSSARPRRPPTARASTRSRGAGGPQAGAGARRARSSCATAASPTGCRSPRSAPAATASPSTATRVEVEVHRVGRATSAGSSSRGARTGR